MLRAALDYAAQRGWPVFPCSPETKRPLVKGGFKDASTDAATIRGWWKRWPKALLAIPTGERTGLFVLDLDVGDPGVVTAGDYLKRLAAHAGAIPDTAIAETGSGGLHLYFTWPSEGAVGIGADVAPALRMPAATGAKARDGKKAKGAQIDVRGEGGYVIVPPSIRADGGVYTWCPGPEDGIAPAPARILSIARKEEHRAARAASDRSSSKAALTLVASTDPGRRYAEAAMLREIAELAGTAAGRNDRLNVAAMKLGQLVAAGALDEGRVRADLEAAAERCGLVTDDGRPAVLATIRSGLAKGLSEPRDLSGIERQARAPVQDVPPPAGDPGKGVAPSSGEGGDDGREPNANGFSMDRMNAEFAFIFVGSKAFILRERPKAPVAERVRYITLAAMHQWSANKFTEYRDHTGKIRSAKFSDRWMSSRRRREYDGVEFHPDPNDAPGTEGYFNLWRGFAVRPAPKRNGYAVFRDHLFTNICNGDPKLYAWVFGFFAHMVQRPRERTGTALVFRGKMGTGKTVVGEAIGSLFPSHFFLVDNARYLTGQFNAHMAQCLLLQADEAVWAGDKEAEGRLRGLITSREQMIEPKGVDPIRLLNFVRIVMTSNEDWVVPAGKEERRFCVLDVSDRCMQNTAYFSEMEAELANGGREALLHDLLAFDLSTVDFRQIPKTGALLEQKIHSLDPIDGWFLDRLMAGAPTRKLSEWPREIWTNLVRDDYLEASDRRGVRRKSSEVEFGTRLKKLMPLLHRKKAFQETPEGLRRVWCYSLPTLKDCRASFEKAVGQAVDWSDTEDNPDPEDAPSGS